MTLLVLVTALAAGVGVVWSPVVGLTVALTPLLLMGLVRPAALAVMGVGVTYVVSDLAGGGGPAKIAPGDLLLALGFVGWLIAVAAGERRWPHGALRPVGGLLLAYVVLLMIATVAHLDVESVVDSVQRVQVVVIALVVGAFVLGQVDLRRAMGAFVLITSAFAVVFAVTFDGETGFGNQKNPAGHFMALAILMAVGSDVFGVWRWVLVIPLSIGMFSTGSRGALLGLAVGLLMLPVMRQGIARRRLLFAILPVVGCLTVTYALLPQDSKDRLSTLESSGPLNSGLGDAEYTLELRDEYRRDAFVLISDNPLTGVGIGNYLAGDAGDGTLTDDPHNVFLLETAEGGLPLGIGLTVLLVGSVVVLVRRRRLTPLASLAGSVQAASIVHGLVDVYWVRGTPTLGWLLVGAALADAQRRRQ